MKHIFVINPTAGKSGAAQKIMQALDAVRGLEQETYFTCAPFDATSFVRQYCAEHPFEQLRFYACGGDGTISEVASGLVGYQNASMSCFPCGSGNDYVKYYGGKERFLDVARLVRGQEREVDLMRVNDRWCVNAFDFGFDSAVCQTMIRIKQKPVIGGKNAYFSGVAWALLHGMRTPCRIEADGEVLTDESILLCTVANGTHVGGAFCCAPRSKNDDGLLEVCIVAPVSRLRFLTLAGRYQKGEHLDDRAFADIITYRRAARFEVFTPKPAAFTVDGDMLYDTHVCVQVVPRALRFAVPREA